MLIDTILHEATTVLGAAMRYSDKLSEVGTIDQELHRMRILITRVAVHSYTDLEKNTNISAEVRELQDIKEVILRAAEQRFGSTSKVLSEFHTYR
jgi:hypothetical protein